MAFTSSLESRIAQLGATWFLPASHYWLPSFYPRGWDSFHCSLRRGRIQVHPTGFALERVQISGWQLRSRHILFMVNTKDLYSAYCPTGGCTHHPSLCLRLSTARLLHSHVCPSRHIVTLLGTSCDFVCNCQAPCPSRYFGTVCADQKLTHQGAFARDISSSSILVEVKRMQSE